MEEKPAREHLKVWQPQHNSGVELMQGNFNKILTPRHYHEELEISLLEHGEPWQLHYRGSQYTVSPLSFTLTQPGEVHRAHFASETDYSFYGLRITTTLFQHVAKEVSEQERELPFFSTPVVTDNYLSRLLLNLYKTLDKSTVSLLEQQVLVLDTLSRLIVHCAKNRPTVRLPGWERQLTRRVRDYLVDNYAESISLEQLAQLASLSPFYLTRVFHKEFGLPPHAYQIHVRIARAKTLLNRGHSLEQVALGTGFANQSHFGWHFRRIVGVTHGQYVKGNNIWKTART